ncbi:unnamed protein product [Leuciscus chuanchicus]
MDISCHCELGEGENATFNIAQRKLSCGEDVYSPITSSTGQINWTFIVHLNVVQVKDGLHAANKVTGKHVRFDSQKMKVSLAAQTLSCLVAVALRTLRDLGYSKFKHCKAMAKFIEGDGITILLQDSSRAFSGVSWSGAVSLQAHQGMSSLAVDESEELPSPFNYHLLSLKNNGGLMIPSEGTVKVVRSPERFIRQSSSGKPSSADGVHLEHLHYGVFTFGPCFMTTTMMKTRRPPLAAHHSPVSGLAVCKPHTPGQC